MFVRDMRWQAQDPWAGAFMHANPFMSMNQYRFRADDGNLSTATWLADASNINAYPNPSEYSKPTLIPGQAFRLRINTEERAGVANTVTVALQYRLNGGTWTTITTSSPVVRMRTSPHVAHGTAVPRLFIQWGSNSINGVFYDTSNGGSFAYPGMTSQESVWSLVLDESGFAGGDVLEFRTTFDGSPPDNIVQTPTAYLSVGPSEAPSVSILGSSNALVEIGWTAVEGATGGYEIEVNGVSYIIVPAGTLSLTHGDSVAAFFRDFSDFTEAESIPLSSGSWSAGGFSSSGLWQAWKGPWDEGTERTVTPSDEAGLFSGRKIHLDYAFDRAHFLAPARDGSSFQVSAGQNYRLRMRFWYSPQGSTEPYHAMLVARRALGGSPAHLVGLGGNGSTISVHNDGGGHDGAQNNLNTPLNAEGWVWLEYEYDAALNRSRVGVGYDLQSLEWTPWYDNVASQANRAAFVGLSSGSVSEWPYRPALIDILAGTTIPGASPPMAPMVQPGMQYIYRVRGRSAAGQNGPWSSPVDITTPPAGDPPPAPTLSLTGVGRRSVSLSWTLVGSGADWYHLYQDGVLIHGTAGDNAAVLDLEPDTTYAFVVRAVNDFGESVDSNTIVVTTDPVEEHSSGSGATVPVAVAGGGVAAGATGWVLDDIIEVGPSDEYLDADVDQQRTYRYFIRAGTEFLWGEWWGPSDELAPSLADREGGAGTGVAVASGGGGEAAEGHSSGAGAGAGVVASSSGGGQAIGWMLDRTFGVGQVGELLDEEAVPARGYRYAIRANLGSVWTDQSEWVEPTSSVDRSSGAGTSVAVRVAGGGVGEEHHEAGAGASVIAASAGTGVPGRQSGGDSTVAVQVAGEGEARELRSGGAGSSVAVSSGGLGAPVHDGGAGTAVAVLVDGGTSASRRHGGGARIAVAAAGGTATAVNGGGSSMVEVASSGHGATGRASGAGASVATLVAGSGSPGMQNGVGAAVEVGVSGEGEAGHASGSSARVEVGVAGGAEVEEHRSNGSGALVAVVSAGAGQPSEQRDGGADAFVAISSVGLGAPAHSDGANSSVAVSAAGAASGSRSGGSGARVAISVAGGTASAVNGGAGAAVGVASAGEGVTERASGAGASVTSSPAGGGAPGMQQGSGAEVEVGAAGAGESLEFRSGGTGATLAIGVAGAGAASRAQGSSTAVAVAVSGSGDAEEHRAAGMGTEVSVVAGGAGVAVEHRQRGAGATVAVAAGAAPGTSRQQGAHSRIAVSSAGGSEASANGGAGTQVAVYLGTGHEAWRETGAGAGTTVAANGDASTSRSSGAGAPCGVFVGGAGVATEDVVGGAGVRVSVDSSGEGSAARTASAGTRVSISSAGGSEASANGGAGTGVAVHLGTGHEAQRGTGASAGVVVVDDGGATSNRQGGAGTACIVSSGGAGTATEDVSTGAGARVSVAVEGAGVTHVEAGAGATINVDTSGASEVTRASGAGAGVRVSVAGGSEASANGGSGAKVDVGVGAGHEARREAGAGTGVQVSVDAGVDSSRRGGAGASLTASSAGAGSISEGAESGAGTSVAVSAGGEGAPELSAGASASITVAVAGDGSRRDRYGGAGASAAITTGSSSSSSRSSGSTAQVSVGVEGAASSGRAIGSSTAVQTSSAGGYAGSINGGASSRLEVSSGGVTRTNRASGGGSKVTPATFGSASPSKRGGSPTYVEFDVSAEAESKRRAGSEVSLIVTAEGAGLAFSSPRSGAGTSLLTWPNGGGAKTVLVGSGSLILVRSEGGRREALEAVLHLLLGVEPGEQVVVGVEPREHLVVSVEPGEHLVVSVDGRDAWLMEPMNEQKALPKEPTLKPAQKDLELYQGDDFTMLVTMRRRVRNEETGEWELGDPINLTNYEPQAQIRSRVADRDDSVDASFIAEIENAEGGVVRLSLLGDVTKGLGKRAVWDFQMIDPNGRRRTYLAGKVRVERDVTRSVDA